jgi:hypothetical protein
MNDYYQYANPFMPLPPTSFQDLKWFNYHSIKTFDYPGGLTLPGLAAFTFILGCISLYKCNKKYLAYLLAPIVMALIASGLERYPFWARTILWLTPILYIIIDEGIASMWHARDKRHSIIAGVILTMLIFVPATRALRKIPTPSTHHEFNKAIDYLVQNWQEGDTLYIRFDDADAYRFCEWRYNFTSEETIIEITPPEVDQEESQVNMRNLQSREKSHRVWFALAYDFPEIVQPFLDIVDQYATKTDEISAIGASAYRYEFTPIPTQ